MPVRIQRERSEGWRMPPDTVYVGRPTIFGNPWSCSGDRMTLIHTPTGHERVMLPAAAIMAQTPADSVKRFRAWLDGSMHNWQYLTMMPIEAWREELLRRLPELRGKDLA